jgi:hypothetical protein
VVTSSAAHRARLEQLVADRNTPKVNRKGALSAREIKAGIETAP